jgi:hypothetical protein
VLARQPAKTLPKLRYAVLRVARPCGPPWPPVVQRLQSILLDAHTDQRFAPGLRVMGADKSAQARTYETFMAQGQNIVECTALGFATASCISTVDEEASHDSTAEELSLTADRIAEYRRSDGVNVIIGTPDNDFLNGTSGKDCIIGLGGHDVINAGAGNDIVFAGSGDDTVHGGTGEDQLFGGSGRDTLSGNQGSDQLHGEEGADGLSGGGGIDTLLGGGRARCYCR